MLSFDVPAHPLVKRILTLLVEDVNITRILWLLTSKKGRRNERTFSNLKRSPYGLTGGREKENLTIFMFS